jgi:5-methylcytosine-specific restriction endonuclease McrA
VPSAVRVALWNTWHGRENGVGKCFCCGCKVAQQDFEAGHVVPASRGGSCRVENLRVLCRTCNRSMAATNMHEFIASHFGDPMDVEHDHSCQR